MIYSLNSRESLREQVAPRENTFVQLTPFRAIVSSNGQIVFEPQTPVDHHPSDKESGRFGIGPTAIAVSVQTHTVTDYNRPSVRNLFTTGELSHLESES